jgi:hypothetical protein
MRFRLSLPLLALLSIAACGEGESGTGAAVVRDTLPGGIESVISQGPTAWADTNGWKLVEDLRFGSSESGGTAELMQPGDFAVDRAGRIYVADNNPAQIKVYGPDGTFLHAVGREGQGPGEYQVAFPAIFDTLLIFQDPQTARTSVFDTAGTFLDSWPSGCCYWMPLHVDDRGRIAIPVQSPPSDSVAITLARTTLDGTPVDTIRLPLLGPRHQWVVERTSGGGRSRSVFSIPWAPSTAFELLPNGGLVLGYSDTYRLTELGPNGDTVRVFGRSWTAPAIPTFRRDSVFEALVAVIGQRMEPAEIRRTFHKSDMPTSAPAWRDMYADPDGQLWLRSIDLGEGESFDVFDTSRVFLGRVPAPSSLGSFAVKWGADGRLYSLGQDKDGLPVMTRYHVERGASGE